MNTLPFTPAMANFFGVKGSGVLVTDLIDENGDSADSGPAAKAGLQPEDVIIEFDGKKTPGTQDLRLAVANAIPGRATKVKVIRKGQEKTFDITVAERKFAEQEKDKYSLDEKEEAPKSEIGISDFDNVPPRVAKLMDISGGALIKSVKPGSLADDAGLTGADQGEGDVIVSVNGKPINNRDELLSAVKAIKSGDAVIFKFLRIAGQRQDGRFVTTTLYTSVIKP
jgi:serine protease Do